MQESELQVFIDAVTNYFATITRSPATVGIPHLKGEEHIMLDFTGIIGIAGDKRGGIYITAPDDMITKIATEAMQMPNPDQAMKKDITGELANIIAGNARKLFGGNFLISVPIIISGTSKSIDLPLRMPVFVIPITWEGTKAYLVCGIEG